MKREFLFQDGKSNKFWTVDVVGKEVVTTNGRVGASPRETRKKFADAAAAAKAADVLARSKLRGGYVERSIAKASKSKVKETAPAKAKSKTPASSKTDWSKLAMSEPVFWKIIALFDWKKTGDDDAVMAAAVGALAQMSVRDIERFDDILADKLFALDTEAHARNTGDDAYVDDETFFSVDEFLYSRCCVVANGQKFYEKILAKPKSMPKDMEFESLLTLAGNAHREKTGKDLKHQSKKSYETFSNKAGWASGRRTRSTKVS